LARSPAGWQGLVVRGFGFGLVGNIIIGILGAILGGWLLGMAGFAMGGILGSIITAFIGAVVLLLIVRLVKRA
jgi:uncharacterized membrane protein YeaQ/YmgE (transglycosylase-associated protein family)